MSEKISNLWNSFCPESLLEGKTVRMRLNQSDFFESEETGLQIAIIPGVQAVILNFRGEKNSVPRQTMPTKLKTEKFWVHKTLKSHLLIIPLLHLVKVKK